MAYNYPFTVVSSVLLFGGAWKCGSAEKTCQGKDRNTGFLESASAISFGVYLAPACGGCGVCDAEAAAV